MNTRKYESELKDVLEVVSVALDAANPGVLELFYMPQNVPGVPRITLEEWLGAREKKRRG